MLTTFRSCYVHPPGPACSVSRARAMSKARSARRGAYKKSSRAHHASILLHIRPHRVGPGDLYFVGSHRYHRCYSRQPSLHRVDLGQRPPTSLELLLQLPHCSSPWLQRKSSLSVPTNPLHYTYLALVHADSSGGSMASNYDSPSNVVSTQDRKHECIVMLITI